MEMRQTQQTQYAQANRKNRVNSQFVLFVRTRSVCCVCLQRLVQVWTGLKNRRSVLERLSLVSVKFLIRCLLYEHEFSSSNQKVSIAQLVRY